MATGDRENTAHDPTSGKGGLYLFWSRNLFIFSKCSNRSLPQTTLQVPNSPISNLQIHEIFLKKKSGRSG